MNLPKNMPLSVGNLPALEADEPVDLEDVLLLGLGDTLSKMVKNFGTEYVSVMTSNGYKEIKRIPQEPNESFDCRIMHMVEGAKFFAEAAELDYSEIIPYVLVIDGWSWNENVFRSPVWMHDHREIPIGDAREIDGLSWLKGSSLEIKSKLKLEQVGF